MIQYDTHTPPQGLFRLLIHHFTPVDTSLPHLPQYSGYIITSPTIHCQLPIPISSAFDPCHNHFRFLNFYYSVFVLSYSQLLYLIKYLNFYFLSIRTESFTIYLCQLMGGPHGCDDICASEESPPRTHLVVICSHLDSPRQLAPPLLNHIPAGAFLYFQHHASPNQIPCFQVQGQEEGSQVDSQHYCQRQWSVVTDTLSQLNWSSFFAATGSPSPGCQPPATAPEPDTAAPAEAHALGRADARYDPLALPISPSSTYGSSSHPHSYPTSQPTPQPTSVPLQAGHPLRLGRL